MSDLSLYKSCLRKIAINLRDGIYKSCHENPLSVMPCKIVNDIMSAALEQQQADGFRADDLEQILTSGKLLELKISHMIKDDRITILQAIIKILNFLKYGCQKLEILYLPRFISASEVFAAKMRSEISEALRNLLENTPNLKDIHSSFSFDLKALRNCRKLRRLRLHFEPRQHWFEFLAKEKDHFQTHKYLEFFTICVIDASKRIPYDDVAIILQHCPELTSLGFIESSGALSQLRRMDISPPELKLRHCCWRDREYDLAEYPSQSPYHGLHRVREEYPSQSPYHGLHRVREAVLNYPTIEELDFDGCFSRSIPCLRNLRNLIYLNISLGGDESGSAFTDALRAIGPQLKHLSFFTASPMDLSLLLQNCHNLESLRIEANEFTVFANPAVSLPNLQRLTFNCIHDNGRRVFSLLCDCNELIELFILDAHYFDDETLHHFLERNSLSNLKVAFLPLCGLTEHGFSDLLLNAPQLEKVEIFSSDFRRNHFERVITKSNHKALCDGDIVLARDEFFERRRKHDEC
ncbi:hypothetical protein AVEN_108753-1 [Araneus ventricosus]|uniref:F-box domain-containing protein n=1 Tax=Araneus ventricosus TaxID=182803 RepID=A0A4Y2W1M9_ARAVE|nr:hypothetical protein AVEN_108753-1 [Araneus ventricosus]